MFRKEYRAEMLIDAELSGVWEVLVDLRNYSKWNSFTPKIRTNWTIGEKVHLTVQMNNKLLQQTEYLRSFERMKEIVWEMKWPFLLRAERAQKLYSTSSGQTRYETIDVIQGLLTPLVHFLYGNDIQRGFENVALGLKAYCEKI